MPDLPFTFDAIRSSLVNNFFEQLAAKFRRDELCICSATKSANGRYITLELASVPVTVVLLPLAVTVVLVLLPLAMTVVLHVLLLLLAMVAPVLVVS